jgi:hypothetical protein
MARVNVGGENVTVSADALAELRSDAAAAGTNFETRPAWLHPKLQKHTLGAGIKDGLKRLKSLAGLGTRIVEDIADISFIACLGFNGRHGRSPEIA